jgi:hypothetical protein
VGRCSQSCRHLVVGSGFSQPTICAITCLSYLYVLHVRIKILENLLFNICFWILIIFIRIRGDSTTLDSLTILLECVGTGHTIDVEVLMRSMVSTFPQVGA